MSIQRLLYLDSRHLSAYVWERGCLAPEGRFAADDMGFAEFSTYLQGRGKNLFRLLVNVPHEDYRVETIPYLRGRERRALIARRINQLFSDSPLARVASLGHEKAQRRNERLLLSAFTAPGDFAPWLNAMAAAEVPLAGIYALSQLGPSLLKKCHAPPERYLFLSLHDDSLRESFIAQGETLFSRRLPRSDGDFATILAHEAARLRQYLASQGHIGRQDTLPIFILAPLEEIGQIRVSFSSAGILPPIFLDSHTLAQKLGIKIKTAESGSEIFFLHLLALAPPHQQYAPADRCREYRFRQTRRTLLACAALALGAALPVAGKGYYDSRAYHEEAAELAAREQALVQRHQELTATLPRLDVDYGTLQKVTARFAQRQQTRRDPGEAYAALSRALESVPLIEIDSIDWKVMPPHPADTGGNEERLILQAHFRIELETPPHEATAMLERFIEALAREPAIHVISQRQETTGSPSLSPQGIEDADSKHFTVEFTRRVAP